ncbi:MAG: paraquat-inducible protein A [Saprospiraceae bacterium]|nr:paraquat-inducible protein A [Saprospiraceae bacterium]
MKQLTIIILSLMLSFGTYKAYLLVSKYQSHKILKEDLAEINKINYGLFNLQLWKEEALSVFENRIAEFEISPKAYRQVEKELEKYLHDINKDYIENGKIFENIFAEAEKSEKVNKFILNMIKENAPAQIRALNIPKFIPSMAIQLASELKKQEPQLRDIMRIELKKIIEDEDFNIYMDPRINFYEKYGQKDLPTTNAILEKMINASQIEIDEMVKWTYGTLLIIFIVAWVLIGYLGSVEAITIITIDSILLLILGVNLPMIDIEAVLNAFTINLLGTNVGFERQYMYYQSKSILDVTQTLIKGGGLDLKIVGWMVLCFSVVFPFIKLVLSGFYLYSDRVRNNKWVQNIIFYLGKWSMADVFVVALFMAYIGFYGIISSQLNSIANNKGGFAVETINNSGLAPGALFFTTYCILSIIVGTLISKRVEGVEKKA